MSDSGTTGKETTVSNRNDTEIETIDTSAEKNTHESSDKTVPNTSEIGVINPEIQENAAVPHLPQTVAMDAIDADENKSTEALQMQHPEIESVSEAINSNEQNLSPDEKTTVIDEPIDSNCKSSEIQSENLDKISGVTDIELQTPVITTDLAVNEQKPQVANSIGSLKLLNQYGSSSDEEEDSSSSDDESSVDDSERESDGITDSSVNKTPDAATANDKQLNALSNDILKTVMSRNNYRDFSSDSSETDSEDSDIECIGSVPAQTIDITNDDEIQGFLDSCEDNAPSGRIKAKGELGIQDLPPIEELTITVQESECVELGKVSGIVDTLVLVESSPGFAAVDIDGSLRRGIEHWASAQDILTKDIQVGQQVYVAPQTEYTNFIVLSDLMRQKGCDASWENDHEAPADCNEFSDDEIERLARRKQNQRQRNQNRDSETSEQLPNKFSIKSETNTSTNTNSNRRGRERRPNFNRSAHKRDRQPHRFYKDNRGYSNPHPESSTSYQQQHQQQMPIHHNYSWHTASMHGMPPASNSSNAMSQTPYAASGSVASNQNPYPNLPANLYPNPFAMQANQLNYGPFNFQAFPPLPPPMSSMPMYHQPSTNSPYTRKNSTKHNQQ